MTDDFCAPFPQCTNFDGRLLINRTLYGPALAREEAELPFGALTLQGGEIRPSIDVLFLQQWRVREACYAPIRSIMGLAPGETVSIDVSRREEVDFATLFQHALDTSTVDSQTSRHGAEVVDIEPSSAGKEPAVGLIPWVIDAIGLGPTGLSLPGSGIVTGALPPIFGGGAGGMPGGLPALPGAGPAQYTDLLSKLITVLFGSGQGTPPIIQDTTTTVDETLTTIETAESSHTLTERSMSVTRATEQRMTRTFANPYRDRSLELRFIPVFRRFEVVTTLLRVRPGIAMLAGPVKFPRTGVVARYGGYLERAVNDPRIVSAGGAELGEEGDDRGARSSVVHDHLEANAELYTKRFLAHAHREGNFGWLLAPMMNLIARHAPRSAASASARADDPDATAFIPTGPTAARALPDPVRFSYGFDWSKAHVQDNAVKVPMAPLENVRYYWPLSVEQDKHLTTAVATVAPSSLGAIMPQPHVRNVHLFIGTHVEAIPGQCVLPHVPDVD